MREVIQMTQNDIKRRIEAIEEALEKDRLSKEDRMMLRDELDYLRKIDGGKR